MQVTDKIRTYLKVRDDLLAVLVEAQKERPRREPYGPDGWILFERLALHAAVNAERRTRGLTPVSIAHVERVERAASGHIDYSRQFALYCAELVFKDIDAIEPAYPINTPEVI